MGTKPLQGEPMVLVPLALVKLAEKVAFYSGTTNDYEISRSGAALEKALTEWQNGSNGVNL